MGTCTRAEERKSWTRAGEGGSLSTPDLGNIYKLLRTISLQYLGSQPKDVEGCAMQKPHTCQCPNCLAAGYHPDKVLHHRLNLLLSRLDEQQRRWLTALESM